MQILLLAYYHPRYMKPLKGWAAKLRSCRHLVQEMYPDEYYKEDVLRELQNDYDLIIYFGHGVPGGWAGFSHISVPALSALDNKRSDRIVFSLSCYSLCAGNPSVGSALLENAYAGTVAGYKDKVKYEENLINLNSIMDKILHKGQLSGKDLTELPGCLEIMRKSGGKIPPMV